MERVVAGRRDVGVGSEDPGLDGDGLVVVVISRIGVRGVGLLGEGGDARHRRGIEPGTPNEVRRGRQDAGGEVDAGVRDGGCVCIAGGGVFRGV